MQRAKIIPIISIAAFIAGGTTVKTLTANQPSVETKLPVKMQLAQKSAPRARTKTLLLEQKLAGLPGFKVIMVLVEGPPGWVGGRHYHSGHLFGYVLEGTFVNHFEDLTSRTIRAGKTFYESPKSVMRSRNGSSTEPVKNIVFQILREGDPPSVSVK